MQKNKISERNQPRYWLVETSDQTFTFIGGKLKASSRRGWVWLTNPDGTPLQEVKRSQVSASSAEAMFRRVNDALEKYEQVSALRTARHRAMLTLTSPVKHGHDSTRTRRHRHDLHQDLP